MVGVIIDKWYLWDVQGFEVRCHLGAFLARNGHFCPKPVKLLLLAELKRSDHESWSVSPLINGTYRMLRNFEIKGYLGAFWPFY